MIYFHITIYTRHGIYKLQNLSFILIHLSYLFLLFGHFWADTSSWRLSIPNQPQATGKWNRYFWKAMWGHGLPPHPLMGALSEGLTDINTVWDPHWPKHFSKYFDPLQPGAEYVLLGVQIFWDNRCSPRECRRKMLRQSKGKKGREGGKKF